MPVPVKGTNMSTLRWLLPKFVTNSNLVLELTLPTHIRTSWIPSVFGAEMSISNLSFLPLSQPYVKLVSNHVTVTKPVSSSFSLRLPSLCPCPLSLASVRAL